MEEHLLSSRPVTLLVLLQLTLLPLCPSAQTWTCDTLGRTNFTRLTPFLSSPLPQIFTIEQAQEDMWQIQTVNVESISSANSQQEIVNVTVWSCDTSEEVTECNVSTSPEVLILLSSCSESDNHLVTLTRNDFPSTATYWCIQGLTIDDNSILICQSNSTQYASTSSTLPPLMNNSNVTFSSCVPLQSAVNLTTTSCDPAGSTLSSHMCAEQQLPICVGICNTEGVFTFRSCFESCINLGRDSARADIQKCEEFFRHIIKNFARYLAMLNVEELLRFFLSLESLLSVGDKIILLHDFLRMDAQLAAFLTGQVIENILDIIEDFVRSSNFDEIYDDLEDSSLQEMLLDTIENLSGILARNYLEDSSVFSNIYARENIFVEVKEVTVNAPNEENRIFIREDVNGILEAELNIPSLGEEDVVAAIVIVRNVGSYLDLVSSLISNISVTSIGNVVTISIFEWNSVSSTRSRQGFRDSPIMLTFPNLNDNASECVSWNFSQRNWSPEGIDSESRAGGDRDRGVQCRISHLSSFSILVSPTGQGGSLVLNVVSYIGCGISIVCLTLTILALIVFRKVLNKGPLLYVHLNLSIALLVSLLIFVSTVDPATSIPVLCVVTTSLLHYFLLASFCWMLCEGILLYLMVVRVFGTAAEKWYWLLPLGWGLPVPVVAISAGVLEGVYSDYTNYPNYCWLKVGSRAAAIWTFIVPMVIIIMINTVILMMTIWNMIKSRKIRGAELGVKKRELAKTAIKGIVFLLPLMGVTWVIGLFAVEENTAVFAWLFTILNSLQGVFILALHVLRNAALQKKLKTCCMKTRPHQSLSTSQTNRDVQMAAVNTSFFTKESSDVGLK